jgi:thiol-disulfide isomerase/thioredoxin
MKLVLKKELIILVTSFLYFSVRTQPDIAIHSLSIGEKCPDFKFDNFVRFSKPIAYLSDFKGKLVILDFWATWCASCVQAIPKLDELQKKYPSKIFVLPVSYEKKEVVESFLKRNAMFKHAELPSITQDSVLSQYFKHRLIPHDIWINGDGKVIAITGAEQVNDSNIIGVLSSKNISLPQKQDIFGQDIDKPILLGGLGKEYQFEEDHLICSSLLSGYIGGLASGNATQVMIENDRVKLLGDDCTLDCLFNMALNATYRSNNALPDTNAYARMRSRMILEVKDSSYFIHRIPGSHNKIYAPPPDKMFCYEIIRPSVDSLKIAAYALEELNNYFGDLLGVEVVKEKRKVLCWVLTSLHKGNIPYSKGGKRDVSIDTDNQLISVQNCPIDDFILTLMNGELLNSPIPMINETEVSQPIDFKIKADPTNPASIGKSLRKYGLDFVLAERELEMNVIRDKTGTATTLRLN